MSILAKWPCNHTVTHDGISPAGVPEEACPFCRLEELEKDMASTVPLLTALFSHRSAARSISRKGFGEGRARAFADTRLKLDDAMDEYLKAVGGDAARFIDQEGEGR